MPGPNRIVPARYVKVLQGSLSFHGGSLSWSLPSRRDDGTYEPGQWQQVDGSLRLHARGLHLTTNPHHWWGSHATAYHVEHEPLADGDGDTGVTNRCRLLRPLTVPELAEHGIFVEGTHILDGGDVVAAGRAYLIVRGEARVQAWDRAAVAASGNVRVLARDGASITVEERALVWAMDAAKVSASGQSWAWASDAATLSQYGLREEDQSVVQASGAARVFVRGRTKLLAWGECRVSAQDTAEVWATDTVQVWASEKATIEAESDVKLYARDSVRVTAKGHALVKASGKTQVGAGGSVVVEASESAAVHASEDALVISTSIHDPDAMVTCANRAVHVDRRGGTVKVRVGSRN